MELNTNGYILHPGFVQSSTGEKCSPLVHISTIFDGDRGLKDIIDDISGEKDKLPEISIIEVEIDPDDWVKQPDDTYKYEYIDSSVNEDMLTEVQADKDNMQLIIKDKIRWILTEDIVGNTIPIYSQKKPSNKLKLDIIIYSKYTKIPIHMEENNWKSGNIAKEFSWYDENINGSQLALFRLDRVNINKFIDNNYSITETRKGHVKIYTDNSVTLNSQIILIETGLDIKEPEDIDPDQGEKDKFIGNVLSFTQRCNLTGSLHDYEISNGVTECGIGEYTDALPNLKILKSSNIIITDTNNDFIDFNSTCCSSLVLNGDDFKTKTFNLASQSFGYMGQSLVSFVDNYNNIFIMVQCSTPYSQSNLIKDPDDIYKCYPNSFRVYDPSGNYTPDQLYLIDTAKYYNNCSFAGWFKTKNNITGDFLKDNKYSALIYNTNHKYMLNNRNSSNSPIRASKIKYWSITDSSSNVSNTSTDSVSKCADYRINYIINPKDKSTSDNYSIYRSKNINLLHYEDNNYYTKYGLEDVSLGGTIKHKDAFLIVDAMQAGYLYIRDIYADVDKHENINYKQTEIYNTLLSNNITFDTSGFAIELRTNSQLGHPSCFNVIAEKQITYIGHDNGIVLVLDNNTLEVIHEINMNDIINSHTPSYLSNNRIKCLDWYDDNTIIVSCVDNPYLYAVDLNGTLTWAHDTNISEGTKFVTNLNQSIYFCYRNNDSEIRLAEWKKL